MVKFISKCMDVLKGVFVVDVMVFECIGVVLVMFMLVYQCMVEYVLVNLFCVVIMCIDEFVVVVDMLIVMVNCFVLVLGFDGYLQFCVGLLCGFEVMFVLVEKLCYELVCLVISVEIFVVFFDEDIVNFDVMCCMFDFVVCECVVDVILGVQCIYVMGFGVSGYLVGLLCYGLDLYCDMVIFVLQLGGVLDVVC